MVTKQIRLVLRRLLAILVVIAILLPVIASSGLTVHADEPKYEEVSFSLNSTVSDKQSITLYLYNSVYYLSIDDLCLLTRSSQIREGNIITVSQGMWHVTFDLEQNLFDDGYQTVNIEILNVSSNKWAVPAIMFLSYFKAAASIVDNTLFCRMPEFTAWEAMNVDFKDSAIDIYKLYGGKKNIEISLWCDILNDFIMGDMSTSDAYLDDAFLAALKVDLFNSTALKKYLSSEQEMLYNDLHSDRGVEFVETLKEQVDSFKDTISYSGEPTKWYIQFYFNELEKSYVNLAYDAYEAGKHSDVTRYGEQFYEAFKEKNNITRANEQFFEDADYVMMFMSAAVNTALEAKYMKATDYLIYDVMGSENIKTVGISAGDDGWFRLANKYKNVLDIGVKQIESEAMRLFTDKLCWETLVGTAVTGAADISGGQWMFCLNLARAFVKLFPLTGSSVEAFKADRIALYLSDLQRDVHTVVYKTAVLLSEDEDNEELYRKFVRALQLYCRVSIAMYENLIVSVKEFGNNRTYWTDLFQAKADKLYVSLYQLTTLLDDGIGLCLPLDLRSFNHVDTSAVTDQTDSSIEINSSEMYKAYYLLCEERQSQNGTGTIENNCLYGLSVVRLVDFDNNGTDELFLAYWDKNSNQSAYEIWSYENGNAKQIFLSKDFYCAREDTFHEHYLRYTSAGGKTYLWTEHPNYSENTMTWTSELLELKNDAFVPIKIWEFTYLEREMQMTRFIDGIQVSEEEFLEDYNERMNESYVTTEFLFLLYWEDASQRETIEETRAVLRMIQEKSKEHLNSSDEQSTEIQNTEKELYVSYILSGGCENIIERMSEYAEECYVESLLADFNGDGALECFVFFSEPMAWNLGAGNYYLLTIANGTVLELYHGYNPGGNWMWSDIVLKKNAETGQLIILESDLWRDGVYSGGGTTKIYSYVNNVLKSSEGYTAEKYAKPQYVSYNQEILDRVKAETSLLYENDEDFWFFKRGDTYISSEEYDKIMAQYIDPGDEYPLVKGTLDAPIG